MFTISGHGSEALIPRSNPSLADQTGSRSVQLPECGDASVHQTLQAALITLAASFLRLRVSCSVAARGELAVHDMCHTAGYVCHELFRGRFWTRA